MRAWLLGVLFLSLGCGDDDATEDGGVVDGGIDLGPGMRRDLGHPGSSLPPEVYEYDWSCSGEVAPNDVAPDAEPPTADCSEGVWPDLDSTMVVCPTITDVTREDPESGMSLPVADTRTAPTTIPVSESGSFLPDVLPETWPTTLKLVAWNMEYTANLDAQLQTLTEDPELADADVWLLSEVDRCSARNGVRRAARMLAEAVEGAYVYGIEFVELSIGRTVGGDTGQAIVSRRPLTGASLLCHSPQYDWFANDGQPRLGSRVVLGAEVPIGNTHTRVWAVHLESNDLLGELRVVQSKELLDASQASACERPQIVAGDFNAWYPQAPELDVLRTAGFADAFDTLGDTEATHQRGVRLDYVWTKGFSVTDGAVLREVETSDHYPMWVELTME